MKKRKNKVELLAPAGNFEKLEIAIHYGADAVYIAGKDFNLRNFSENFTIDEIKKAVALAHKYNVKLYVACNVYSRNFELKAIADYLVKLGKIGPDALIIADPGIIMEARALIPNIPIHLSTQANTTNYKSALFWENLGVKRINIARELSLNEIKKVASRASLEIEAFVHGAMCISYSGRCLLSSFMANRDGNRGMCAQACRWKYAVVEELRPGEYFPVFEDNQGSYIFSSSDLCMIKHIPEMIEAGIVSLKIEGRMKGINYVASTVRVYREAIDSYYSNNSSYKVKKEWIKELEGINNRSYCTGFYLGVPGRGLQNYSGFSPASKHYFLGKVLEKVDNQNCKIDVRNKIFTGEAIEVLVENGSAKKDVIRNIVNQNGRSIPFAQPNSIVTITLNVECSTNDLIRRNAD